MSEMVHCNNCGVNMMGRCEMFDVVPHTAGQTEEYHQWYNFDYCHLCESEKYDVAYTLVFGRDRVTAAPIDMPVI